MEKNSRIILTGEENKNLYNEKTLVMQIKWGGLGDHLFHSHIPRIAKETKMYDKVYLSELSDFRSIDYKRLIWDKNPYLDGYVKKGGWYPEIPYNFHGTNYLDMIMLGYGLDDGKRWHEPEIFYKPCIKSELINKNVYDPNFITNAGYFDVKNLKKYLIKNCISIDMQLTPVKTSVSLDNIPFIKPESLEDYCSIIVSCNNFFCLASGGATLAAALQKPSYIFYHSRVKEKFLHSNFHQYVFIKRKKKTFIHKIYNRLTKKMDGISFRKKK